MVKKYERLLALVIGLSDYHYLPPREGGVDHARAIGEFLKKHYGFEVRYLLGNQISRPSIIFNEFNSLIVDITANDLLLFYYIGHGMNYIRGGVNRSYITIPTSIKGRPSTAIDIGKFFSALNVGDYLFLLDTNLEKTGEIKTIDTNQTANILKNIHCVVANNESNNFFYENSKTGLPLFSKAFVESLRRASDLQDKFTISNLVENILEYLKERNSYQTTYFDFTTRKREDEIYISPIISDVALPEYIVRDLYEAGPGSREDAVLELSHLLNNDEIMAKSAREKLIFISMTDEDLLVRQAANLALGVSFSGLDFELKTLLSEIQAVNQSIPLHPELIEIPDGAFIMGGDENEALDDFEMPRHSQYLPTYHIAKSPITNLHYLQFVLDTDYPPPDHWESKEKLLSILDHPVTMVSWYDAIAYCDWLGHQLRKKNFLKKGVVRLPTEAEWEKAARGGDGRKYPWGNTFSQTLCNCVVSGIGTTTPVGSYSKLSDSPYGCVDMSGNVWEWTASLWGKGGHKPTFLYPYNANDGREHQAADSSYRRIIRGGGYYYFSKCVTCVTRNRSFPNDKHNGGGFRIVVSDRILK